MLNELCGKEVSEQQKKELDDYFYGLSKPKVFWGSDGVEAKHDKGFESICALMTQFISRDPKKMTTLEFMQTLEELKKQYKPERSKRNGRGR